MHSLSSAEKIPNICNDEDDTTENLLLPVNQVTLAAIPWIIIIIVLFCTKNKNPVTENIENSYNSQKKPGCKVGSTSQHKDELEQNESVAAYNMIHRNIH